MTHITNTQKLISYVCLLFLILSCSEGKYKTSNGYFNEANIRFKEAKYDEAIALLDQAIQLDSNKSSYYLLKGECLNALGQFQESLSPLNKAVGL